MSDSVIFGMSTSPLDSDLMNDFSLRFNTGLNNYYKDFTIETTSLESEILPEQNLLNIIIEFINKAKDKVFSVLNDVLSTFFDTIIEIMLRNSKLVKKDPIISFRSLFALFHSFGLKEISLKTMNLITSAIQYKICSTNWVGDEEFWLNYIEDLPRLTVKETEKTFNRFIRTLKSMKFEEDRLKNFNFELNEFINFD